MAAKAKSKKMPSIDIRSLIVEEVDHQYENRWAFANEFGDVTTPQTVMRYLNETHDMKSELVGVLMHRLGMQVVRRKRS